MFESASQNPVEHTGSVVQERKQPKTLCEHCGSLVKMQYAILPCLRKKENNLRVWTMCPLLSVSQRHATYVLTPLCSLTMTLVLLQKRIKDHYYRSIDDLEVDIMLLCKNAQAYNMEGSLVSERVRDRTTTTWSVVPFLPSQWCERNAVFCFHIVTKTPVRVVKRVLGSRETNTSALSLTHTCKGKGKQKCARALTILGFFVSRSPFVGKDQICLLKQK